MWWLSMMMRETGIEAQLGFNVIFVVEWSFLFFFELCETINYVIFLSEELVYVFVGLEDWKVQRNNQIWNCKQILLIVYFIALQLFLLYIEFEVIHCYSLWCNLEYYRVVLFWSGATSTWSVKIDGWSQGCCKILLIYRFRIATPCSFIFQSGHNGCNAIFCSIFFSFRLTCKTYFFIFGCIGLWILQISYFPGCLYLLFTCFFPFSFSILKGKMLAICSAATKSSVVLCLENLIGMVYSDSNIMIEKYTRFCFLIFFIFLPRCRIALRVLIASLQVCWVLLRHRFWLLYLL